MSSMTTDYTTLLSRMGNASAFSQFIYHFYDNMLDDYRINRFFNTDGVEEQKRNLAVLLTTLLSHDDLQSPIVQEQLDDYFISAFSRAKRKSFTSGSDWSFFGEVIEHDEPNTELLSEAHFSLLRLLPDDENYDAALEILKKTLVQSFTDKGLINDVMDLAESLRDAVLGRKPIDEE